MLLCPSLHWGHHRIPLFFLAQQQFELWIELVSCAQIGSWRLLGQVLQTSLDMLRKAKHRWQVVKGSLAACQAMLLGHGWSLDAIDCN